VEEKEEAAGAGEARVLPGTGEETAVEGRSVGTASPPFGME